MKLNFINNEKLKEYSMIKFYFIIVYKYNHAARLMKAIVFLYINYNIVFCNL